ncbi:Yip1 family protein [Flavobacterium alkalisoli]|uniref:Yip1 family protein n=1 Tax=Flavobacterium alkalisoli TaxID=2602769 RepID=UPI003A92ADE4
MFKKIQNHLLLRHPLLWNTKFVPVLIITLIVNLAFFIGGYISGAVDFTDPYDFNALRAYKPIVTFLAVVIALLVIILWLVFYVRNNAFKSFYPKKNNSLYKEWLIILIVCLLNVSYIPIYQYAYDLRARNYFDKEEVIKRADIISKASLFVNGSFHPWKRFDRTIYNELLKEKTAVDSLREYYEDVEIEAAVVETQETEYYDEYDYQYDDRNDDYYNREWDTVCYFENEYKLTSLMNRQKQSFSIQPYINDSLNEWKVKRWMLNREKDSVRKVLDDFFTIANEHGLKANITSEEWFNFIYKPDMYEDYQIVGTHSEDAIHDERKENKDYTDRNDTENNFTRYERMRMKVYPKYHVPFNQLYNGYDRISGAYVSPINFKDIVGYFIFAFVLSFLIFSFKVTSVKSWLIAAVSIGVLGLVTFIFSLVADHFLRLLLIIDELTIFLIIWTVIIAACFFYFLHRIRIKTSKKISGIIVNALLWLLPTGIIIIRAAVSYYSMITRPAPMQVTSIYYYDKTPLEEWIDENIFLCMYFWLLIVLLYMYPLTRLIKKWKGIAEA